MTYRWRLYGFSKENRVERYCHNCGRKAVLQDSLKRRRNANGKMIYVYAIYKCEKDHTWNKLLSTHKPINISVDTEREDADLITCSYDVIDLSKLGKEGFTEVEIILEEVEGRWRIDKLLAARIPDLSRDVVNQLIRDGRILLDGKATKPDSLVKKDQVIGFMLADCF